MWLANKGDYQGKGEPERVEGMAEDTVSPLVISNRDEAEAAGAQIVELNILRNAALAKQQRVQFAAQKLKGRIDDLGARVGRYEQALQEWARGFREQEFKGEKSLDLRHVVLRFKMAPRSIVLLKDWTVDLVLKALQRRPKLRQYIRIKRELDRQRLLSDSKPDAGRIGATTLAAVGLGVAQEELFYIEPKLDTQSPTKPVTADAAQAATADIHKAAMAA